jgi:hypothetical protein
MNEKEKATVTAAPEIDCKGKHFPFTYQVLEILKSGQKVTAIGFNDGLKFNDARKSISLLRKMGYPIMDYRLSDRRKVYYLPHNWEEIRSKAEQCDKQAKLF